MCVYFCHIEKCPPSKSDESWPSLLWLVDCTAVWRFYCRFYVKFCVNSRPTLLPLCGGRLYADFSRYIKLSHPSGVLCVGVTQALWVMELVYSSSPWLICLLLSCFFCFIEEIETLCETFNLVETVERFQMSILFFPILNALENYNCLEVPITLCPF